MTSTRGPASLRYDSLDSGLVALSAMDAKISGPVGGKAWDEVGVTSVVLNNRAADEFPRGFLP